MRKNFLFKVTIWLLAVIAAMFGCEDKTASADSPAKGVALETSTRKPAGMEKNLFLFFFFFLTLVTSFRLPAQQWQRVVELPEIEMSALFSSGDTLFVAGANKLYLTFDGGASWDSTAVLHPHVDFIEAVCYTEGRLFAGTLSWGVFRSDDLGNSWQADNTGLTGLGAQDISSLASRGDSLYAGTYGAGVFVKSISNNSGWSNYNNGLTWMNVESLTHLNGRLYAGAGGNATYFVQSSPGHAWMERGFAVFNGSLNSFLAVVLQGDVLLAAGTLGLYRSTDDGENWAYYNPGTGILGSARLLIDGNRVIANLAKPAALSFIQYTDDQGLTWYSYEPEIAGSYGHDIALLNGVLYAARSNGLWRVAATTPVHEPAGERPMLGRNYPNPFSGSTTIPVELAQSARVDLSVFDANGRFIQRLWRGEQAAGKHEIEFQARRLPPGIYISRLATPAGVLTQRMVLVD